MLTTLGQSGAEQIDLRQVRQIKAQIEGTPVSEAGVVLAQAADDPAVQQFITDAIAVIGGAPHPSGQAGITSNQLNDFAAQVATYLDWHAQGQVQDEPRRSELYPLGDRTANRSHRQSYAVALLRGNL